MSGDPVERRAHGWIMFYQFLGPVRFWLIIIITLYSGIYGAKMYIAGMRRAHEFHALGIPMSVQRCVNNEFSERLSRRDPFLLLYIISIFAFFVVSISTFIGR